MAIADLTKINEISQILSPNKQDQGVWIHQDAWFHLLKTDKVVKDTYQMKKTGNGVYIFIIEGEVSIENELLNKRDAIGVWETEQVTLSAKANSSLLFIEVPMNF